MSNISAHSKNVKPIQSIPPKPAGLKSEDLQLVAERLALIQGHISHMPIFCISGAVVMDGFLLVALRIPDHALEISSGGEWLLDGRDITNYATNSEQANV